MFVPVVISKNPLMRAVIISLLMPTGANITDRKDENRLIMPVSIKRFIITEKRMINPPMESNVMIEFFIASPKAMPKFFFLVPDSE